MSVWVIIFGVAVAFIYLKATHKLDDVAILQGIFSKPISGKENLVKLTAQADKLEADADIIVAIRKQKDRIVSAKERIKRARASAI